MRRTAFSLGVVLVVVLLASGAALASPVLVGTDGNDMLLGTGRADTIRGGPGDDTINGLRGEDHIYGGTGKDAISGGPQDDIVSGGPGDDTVFAQDVSTDRVSCGRGRDTVITDGKDLIDGVQALKLAADASIERTCENIQINDWTAL